jgi:hypothetical protein
MTLAGVVARALAAINPRRAMACPRTCAVRSQPQQKAPKNFANANQPVDKTAFSELLLIFT